MAADSGFQSRRQVIGREEDVSEEQIIGFLRETEMFPSVLELCRRRGFSEARHYLWRNKFGGTRVSDTNRLKGLELESVRVKRLLAESMLGNEVKKEALRKKR